MKDYNKEFKYKFVLDKINSNIFKKDIISFDVETHDNNQSFTLGSIYDGVLHSTYYDRKTMRDKLLNTRYQNTLLVATNLQFDFCALENMKEFSKYDIISRGGRFIMIKKRTRYKYKFDDRFKSVTFSNTFIDSLNHYAGSVESAGKIIGLTKLEHPDFLGKQPSNEKEWEYLKVYNHRDTEVTYRLMKFLQDSYNDLGCEMKTTISSTALDLWRRKYLPQSIYREEFILGHDVKHEIFKCYYGGRTEIFGRGVIESSSTKKWKLLDFNSLYPSCMMNSYPLPQSIQKPNHFTIDNIKNFEGFSDVDIECDTMFYPLLPYRDFKRGKLIFPVGRWRSSYTHVELRKALELGYRILKIHLQYIYTQVFYPFKDYVTNLYDKRLEYQKEKNPMEVVVKLLMNSLYGKLAQKDFTEFQWFDIEDMTATEYQDYLDSNNSTTFNNIGFKRVVKECDTNFIFPILPAYVTSYGRLKLYDAIVKYNAVYCDTDSVITCSDHDSSNKLGDLKVEDKLKKVIIIRPKMYMKIDELEKIKVKIKGIPRANVESFERILQRERVFFSRFTKPNESIRHGYDVNMIRQDSKSVSLDDNKRVWRKEFDYKTFDFCSEPPIINDVTIHQFKHVTHKTIRDKMDMAERERQRIQYKIQKQFINSDLFDKDAVGKDISSEEFLENEKWFERNG